MINETPLARPDYPKWIDLHSGIVPPMLRLGYRFDAFGQSHPRTMVGIIFGTGAASIASLVYLMMRLFFVDAPWWVDVGALIFVGSFIVLMMPLLLFVSQEWYMHDQEDKANAARWAKIRETLPQPVED